MNFPWTTIQIITNFLVGGDLMYMHVELEPFTWSPFVS